MSEGYKFCSHLISEHGLCSPDPSSNLLPLKHQHKLFHQACRRPVIGDRENQLVEYNETSYFPVNCEYFFLFCSPSLSLSLSPPPPQILPWQLWILYGVAVEDVK